MEDFRSDSKSKSRLRLWLRLLKASHLIEQVLREKMRAELATTLPRFDVMAALSRHPGGLRMSELSKILKVSNGNVTGIIDRLVSEGLVERTRVEEDRRAFIVRLSDEGTRVFTVQARAHEAWINDLLDRVSTDDASHLSSELDRITNSLNVKELSL